MTAILIFGRRYRRLYGVVAVSLSLLFLFSPVLQAFSIGRALDVAEASTQSLPEALGIEDAETAETATVKNEPLSRAERSEALSVPNYTRSQNRVGTTICGEGDEIDTDMDGLSDNVENCLGTDPKSAGTSTTAPS